MPKLTLTFDNGPDPETTPMVLDILARRGIKTTFFVIGDKLRDPDRRALAERAHGEGHWIGNHTFNHITPLGDSRDPNAHLVEIARTQALLGDLAHPRKFFRPNGGGGAISRSLLSEAALRLLVDDAFTLVLWNVVPRDWEDPIGWPQTTRKMCADHDWPLLVLHDLPTGAMDRLDAFLAAEQDAGTTFEQEFPPDCTPVECGAVIKPVDAYVSPGA